MPMPRPIRSTTPLLLAAACAAPPAAEERVQVREEVAVAVTVADAGPGDPPLVAIRYAHERSCARFLGRAGRFHVFRVVRIDNAAPDTFTFEPARLRFPDDGSGPTEPTLLVPEFSDAEVPAGTGAPTGERFLVERAGAAPPPRGPVQLGYEGAGVHMLREGPPPSYDDGTGCDDLNT